MKHTILTAIMLITACTANPNGTIKPRVTSDNEIIVTIIDRDEAMRRLNNGETK